jgi:hypothetical protein
MTAPPLKMSISMNVDHIEKEIVKYFYYQQ